MINNYIFNFRPYLGDEFEQLSDADDQGWSKGRKDGRVGLYPGNYATGTSSAAV